MNIKRKQTKISGLSAWAFMSSVTMPVWAEDTLDNYLHPLLSLPDPILVGLLAGLFSVVFLLLLLAYNRWLAVTPSSKKSWYALITGAITGVMVGVLVANIRKEAIEKQVKTMPPTAAGRSVQRDVGVLVDLLETPDANEVAGLKLKMPLKVMPGRARHAQVNINAADADTLNLNLFDDVFLVAIRDRIEKSDKGYALWIGHIEDDETSQVVLAFKGKVMMGTVDTQGKSFEIVYVSGNTHAVRELDLKKVPEKYEPDNMASLTDDNATMVGLAGETTSTTTGTVATGGVATGEVIDLLVVYTPQARINAGGISGIETKILNAVANANQSYLNSQVNMSLNLVAMSELNYVETGIMTTSLSNLRSKTDGVIDEVHVLRDQYLADQVAFITADSDYCGIAPIMTSSWINTNFAANAFVLVHDDSKFVCLGNNTLAHELGHNQGNAHNIENATNQPGAYPDSYGYRVSGVFRDVMSYVSAVYEPRIPYFSNPNVLFNGQSIGLLGSADIARSMNATAPIVASFRVPPSATVPNAPTGLAAKVVSTSNIDLTWLDNAADETGYYLQRSLDSVTWTLIATLGSNAVSFTDSALLSGTTYYYRVYAYNSLGNSGYSSVAKATTNVDVTLQTVDSIAPLINFSNPIQGSKVNSTSQSVNVSATDNVGVKSLQLYIDNKLVSSTNASSLSYTWNTKRVASGNHNIMSKAGDAAGNTNTFSITVTK